MDLKVKKEMYQIQKASLWKRFAAGLLDIILILIIATGCMVVISAITGYDSKTAEMQTYYDEYEEKYNVNFDISKEEYEKLTEEEKKLYEEVSELITNDERIIKVYNYVVNLMLLMTSIGILIAVIIVEFILPIILKNGQTLGKKCMGICLVKTNSVKVNTLCLFVRSILGIYTIEIMIPLYVLILLIFGSGNFIFLLLAAGIVLLNLGLLITSQDNILIHDAFASTVVVDKSVQMIFENEEELIEFKKELHAKEVENKKY